MNKLWLNNICSDVFGLFIGGQKTFNAPERDINLVSVPGRDGDVLYDNGRFKNVDVSYNIVLLNSKNSDETIKNIRNWIYADTGYLRIEDTYHPDEYRLGVKSKNIEFELYNLNKFGKSTITFNCQPQRFKKSGDYFEKQDVEIVDVIENVSGKYSCYISNDGDYPCNPEIRLKVNQNINCYLQNSDTGETINISGYIPDHVEYIDIQPEYGQIITNDGVDAYNLGFSVSRVDLQKIRLGKSGMKIEMTTSGTPPVPFDAVIPEILIKKRSWSL